MPRPKSDRPRGRPRADGLEPISRKDKQAYKKAMQNRRLYLTSDGKPPPWRTDSDLIGKLITRKEAKVARRLFLIELKQSGIISVSARKVGLPPSLVYSWRERYPKFDERIEVILDEFVDAMESVAYQRAMEKSDTLLMAFLRAHRPEKYGNKIEGKFNHHNHAPVQVVFSPDEVGEADVQAEDASQD